MQHLSPETLKTIDEVTTALGHKMKFGCYDADDIKQQSFIFAVETLPKWDGKRDLSKFLYCCLKNLIINWMRDEYRRTDCPCKICKAAEENGERHTGHKAGQFCKIYLEWIKRNDRKQLLAGASPTDKIPEQSFELQDSVDHAHITALIDEHLDHNLRADYLHMIDGQTIPKYRREKVRLAVREIISKFINGENNFSN